MKVRVDIRDGRGTLFCGCVDASSTVAALRSKMTELAETMDRRPFASMSMQAQPWDVMRKAAAERPQAPLRRKEGSS